MAVFLLDTNIIIDALNDKKNRNQALLALAEAGNVLACCPINVAEVYAGVRPKGRAAHSRAASLAQALPHHL
jgi:predicted nucleic acid-binding protein